MPDGRMLKKKISLNEAVADLANDTHRMLFTWALAHLDVKGRISGSPRQFRAIVVPLLDHITNETIVAFFIDAQDKELLRLYEVDGVQVIEYPKFTDPGNQKLNPDREAKSKYPDPPSPSPNQPVSAPDLVGSKSGVGPEQAANIPDLVRSKSGVDPGQPESTPDLVPLSLSLSEVKSNSASALEEADASPPSPPMITPAKVFHLWNDLGCKPSLAELTTDRSKRLAVRIRKRGDPAWWERLFLKAKAANKPWLTFDFLIANDTNAIKLLEGNYDHDFGPRGPGGKERSRFGTHQNQDRTHPGKYAAIGRTFTTDPGAGGAGLAENSSGQGGVPDPSESPT